MDAMLSANGGICDRSGSSSGCSLDVQGISYSFCSSCPDAAGQDHCPHGVQSNVECDFGAGLLPPSAVVDAPVPECPNLPQVMWREIMKIPDRPYFGSWMPEHCQDCVTQCDTVPADLPAKWTTCLQNVPAKWKSAWTDGFVGSFCYESCTTAAAALLVQTAQALQTDHALQTAQALQTAAAAAEDSGVEEDVDEGWTENAATTAADVDAGWTEDPTAAAAGDRSASADTWADESFQALQTVQAL